MDIYFPTRPGFNNPGECGCAALSQIPVSTTLGVISDGGDRVGASIFRFLFAKVDQSRECYA